MITVVGQSVVDRVKLPGRSWVERLGGAPIFAGQALAMAGVPAVVLTRGASAELRRPLHALGLRVIEGPGTGSCIAEMVLSPDGSCADSFRGFGDPFTPSDVRGWMAPGLSGARAVVCGAQWRGDFPPMTLGALAEAARPIYLDGQGPLRATRLGPLHLDGTLGRAFLRHVTVLKLAEEEARVALGGADAVAAQKLGVPVVVVTLGERGAVVLADGRATAVGVEPIRGLVDTIGAGDAFLALMAAAGAEGAGPVESARFACAQTAELLRRRLAETPGVGVMTDDAAHTGPDGCGALRSAVLFDFGGTLDADGVAWKARVFRLFHEEGLVSTLEGFDPIFYAADDALLGAIPPTGSLRDTVDRLFQGVAERLKLAAADGVVRRLAARFLDASYGQLRDNTPLLRRLAAHYRLGVVSNFYGNLATVCDEAGIGCYFTTLIDSATVGYRKPEAAIFRHALQALGLPPAAALFVGDSLPRDMVGARGIGMPHIWLTPAASGGDGPCCPDDRVIRSLGELEGLLR